jgi:predicted HD phosphohydrolase
MRYEPRMSLEGPAATTFTRMTDATAEDYATILRHSVGFLQALPDRILRHLALLAGDTGGYAVDRLTHCLQTATRAHRDERDEEYVVCALVHDIGDTLATLNHSELAAVVVEPFVSEENHWIVKHHGVFQGYYFFHHLGLDRNMRDRYRDHSPLARVRALLRGLRPEQLRSALRHAAARLLRAHGATCLRRAEAVDLSAGRGVSAEEPWTELATGIPKVLHRRPPALLRDARHRPRPGRPGPTVVRVMAHHRDRSREDVPGALSRGTDGRGHQLESGTNRFSLPDGWRSSVATRVRVTSG